MKTSRDIAASSPRLVAAANVHVQAGDGRRLGAHIACMLLGQMAMAALLKSAPTAVLHRAMVHVPEGH